MYQYWNNTAVYQRALEILEDYWTTEPDEACVAIRMQFIHRNGECQDKYLTWYNPNLSEQEKKDALRLLNH